MSHSSLRSYAFAYQPILGKNQSQVAMELMYQSTDLLATEAIDSTEATAKAIINAILHVGSEHSHFFVGVGEDLLMSDMLTLLPRGQTTLEVRGDAAIKSAVVERCRQLKEAGYRVGRPG